MPTINQLVRKRRRKPRRGSRCQRVLQGRPQRGGVVDDVTVLQPRKPNAGNRKVVRVQLVDGPKVTCFVPGEGHKLQAFTKVLIRSGNVRDLPGVRYKIVRGARKFDCRGVDVADKSKVRRNQARSKYGTKKLKNE